MQNALLEVDYCIDFSFLRVVVSSEVFETEQCGVRVIWTKVCIIIAIQSRLSRRPRLS